MDNEQPHQISDKWSLELGDSLERSFAEKLRQFIPHYEILWSTFIGNDGHNNAVEIAGFPKEALPVRRRFSEYHYTVGESILCMDQCVSELLELSHSNSPVNMLRFQNSFLAYFAHMGRTYDNLSNCVWDIGLIINAIREDKKDEFDKHQYVSNHMERLIGYYNQRHVVIHGKKIPLGVTSDGVLVMPIIRNDKNSTIGWYSALSWSQIDNPEDLVQQLQSIFKEFSKEVNSVLASLYGDLMEYLKKNKLGLLSPLHIQKQSPVNVYQIDPTKMSGPSTLGSGSSASSGTSGWNGSSGFGGDKF